MKKLFFLAAACCLAMSAGATCTLIGNSIPSGTGVNARSIVNIQYNQNTKVLSFEDTYEPTFAAYKRVYSVYFYEYSEDYAFYLNGSGSYLPTYYGDGCNDDAFIPCPTHTGDLPVQRLWTGETIRNCAGGMREIDLSDVIPQIAALGYNHVMVGICPSYNISESATPVDYSTYGDWHYWLMNVADFTIIPLVVRVEAFVSEVHTPTGVIDNTIYDSPFEAENHVYICEGQDTAKLQINIFPTSDVTKPVTYFWQTRKDNETTWTEKKGDSFTTTEWNNAVTANSALQAYRNFRFVAGDMDNATYFRLGLVSEGDTLYSGVCQIDAKYRLQISGPVSCKLGDEAWNDLEINGSYPNFDTAVYEVSTKDTILLKPYHNKLTENYCGINIGGAISTTPAGMACITDIWYSGSITPTLHKYDVKLYVDGVLCHSFSDVLCGFTVTECGNTTIPTNPTKKDYTFSQWLKRGDEVGAQIDFVMGHLIIEDEIWDAVFENEPYAVQVKGIQVTGSNRNDILADGGSAYYSDGNKTLTLKNANISYADGEAIVAYQDMVIECIGTNTIESTGSDHAISVEGLTTFTGSGSLTAKSNTWAAVYSEDGLTVKDGCTLIAQSTDSYAVSVAGGTITVDGATLNAKGNGKEATIMSCNSLVLKNGAAIRSGHTYDDVNHMFLNAQSEEAKDDIIIGVSGGTTAIGEIQMSETKVQKIMVNGVVYILRGDKVYNLQGIECELPRK